MPSPLLRGDAPPTAPRLPPPGARSHPPPLLRGDAPPTDLSFPSVEAGSHRSGSLSPPNNVAGNHARSPSAMSAPVTPSRGPGQYHYNARNISRLSLSLASSHEIPIPPNTKAINA